MCQWSNNDRKYIVNELLRFALAQNEDFLKYKAGLAAGQARSPVNTEASTGRRQDLCRIHLQNRPLSMNSARQQ